MTDAAATGSGATGGRVRYVPGQPDMWAFVLFEALIFSSYFIVYMIRRGSDPDLFLASQERLSPAFGVSNTLVLLLSSWLMARCVQASREKKYDVALGQVILVAICGLLFAGLKLFEWSREMGEGLRFSTNEFFSFYYFLTAIHLLHVLIGFVALGVAVYQLRSPLSRSQEIVETCATYWHMVDFLWVIIFALLYVMR
ncbi:MAG: cytochrome c oxidase subunit 3 family protein [Nevskia sp.]|nr:cytochrome c oxidase subunit 3 family protein [Nevskia sp.]